MKFEYPFALMEQSDGSYLITFPDVPEAVTDIETKDETLSETIDCLIAALGGYINEGRDIPNPSIPEAGQETVIVPPLVSAKLALYKAICEEKITYTTLGEMLGLNKDAIGRLVDLDHRSHIEQVNAALTFLGKRLVVEVQDAA